MENLTRALTPDDLARLRVPLTAMPGLDPVGLVVEVDETLWGGVVVSDMGGEVGCGIVVARSAVDTMAIRRSECVLHLSDAATRDRCARWLAARLGIQLGCTAPLWEADCGMACWSLDCQGAGAARFPVAALAALDPTDDRRLPDGSRWVDAAALAAVCVARGAHG